MFLFFHKLVKLSISLLVQELLKTHDFALGILQILLHQLNMVSAALPLPPQILQRLHIHLSTALHRRILNVSEHVGVLLEVLGLLKLLDALGRPDAILGAHLLVLVLLVSLQLLLLLDLFAEILALLQQVHVLAHDQDVVRLVDLIFDFDSLLQRVHGVLEELALVFVLLLDVRVNLTVLRLLVLDEVEETSVDGNLQLLVIIGVLDDLVDGVFELVDVVVVVPDDVAVRLDRLLDDTLSQPEIFNHVAKAGIHIVESPQSLVHLSGLVPQICNLELFGSDVLS